jgi:hypothetical protein
MSAKLVRNLQEFVHAGPMMQIKINGSHKSAYGQAIQKMDHNVLETGLYSDPQLIALLDTHPETAMDIYRQSSFQPCARGTASGAALLEAVRRGVLWINLRRLETVQSNHGHVVRCMHNAFARHMGVKTSSRMGGLVISSAEARVGYNIAATDMALWHLRGRKRIYLYPNRAPFIRPRHVQNIALQGTGQSVPYKREFETESIAIDLEPGEVICWPHLSPYRVDNLEALNVSLNLESLTGKSRRRMGSYFFDGYVNRVFGTQRAVTQPGPVSGFAKTAASGLIKKAGIVRAQTRPQRPQFKVNLAYPDGVEPL